MWTGAVSGLARLKFSTSPRRFGNTEDNVISDTMQIRMYIKSLFVINGLNLILSKFVLVVCGFEEPFSWRKIKCTIIIMNIINGRRKCREKNRFSVG